mmetsp:Transcript_13673/g.20162  ORF Transcript_13673/g.20162 Transcript_13673/m.20162 type:complete len:95 (-) Transcript_13673:27-311(-)
MNTKKTVSTKAEFSAFLDYYFLPSLFVLSAKELVGQFTCSILSEASLMAIFWLGFVVITLKFLVAIQNSIASVCFLHQSPEIILQDIVIVAKSL